MTAEQIAEQLQQVCAAFHMPGVFRSYDVITAGNINNTYRVSCQNGDHEELYTIQCVNTYVFRSPERIMKNIELITTHIGAKQDYKPHAIRLSMQQFFESAPGRIYAYIDGKFWRAYRFIDNAIAYDICDDPAILKAAGQAFGAFQSALSDFDALLLETTIPDFHNTRKRLDAFFHDVEEDSCGRVAEVADEIAYIASMRETACRLNVMQDQGLIPIRATHNDTKTNNVLLDEATNTPVAVIDLDTVMPGLAMHDFGDAVRFAANTAAEDEPDISKVSLDLDRYRAFAEGFIEQTAQALTKAELDSMALGALTITIELAVRFLDDYLTGDKYFKCRYPGHNLVRARCQLALARDMERKFADMDRIVQDVCAKSGC